MTGPPQSVALAAEAARDGKGPPQGLDAGWSSLENRSFGQEPPFGAPVSHLAIGCRSGRKTPPQDRLDRLAKGTSTNTANGHVQPREFPDALRSGNPGQRARGIQDTRSGRPLLDGEIALSDSGDSVVSTCCRPVSTATAYHRLAARSVRPSCTPPASTSACRCWATSGPSSDRLQQLPAQLRQLQGPAVGPADLDHLRTGPPMTRSCVPTSNWSRSSTTRSFLTSWPPSVAQRKTTAYRGTRSLPTPDPTSESAGSWSMTSMALPGPNSTISAGSSKTARPRDLWMRSPPVSQCDRPGGFRMGQPQRLARTGPLDQLDGPKRSAGQLARCRSRARPTGAEIPGHRAEAVETAADHSRCRGRRRRH
ncbi:MAG: hypothetical protein Ct9H300mP1_10090 [Planctomycetaceae bacterium]|nr:MAG: hypothetical protein Ct9H300mP1_10090 [Planctomycetaceae bacterium]